MENYEYNKVYPFDSKHFDIDPDEAEDIKKILLNHEQDLKNNPRFLLPFAPALFEKAVADCEQIAEEFSGRIKAKIDYENYTASIEIWCCYVEFAHGKFMSILHEISQYAMLIRFEPLTSGDLHIEILMPYFASASDSDKNE